MHLPPSCNSNYFGYTPSNFKLQVRWLRAFTSVTYLCKLLRIHALAAFLKLELFWVYYVVT